MELWKFVSGSQSGKVAVVVGRRTIDTAGGKLYWLCELLVGDKLIELPESALHDLAESVKLKKDGQL